MGSTIPSTNNMFDHTELILLDCIPTTNKKQVASLTKIRQTYVRIWWDKSHIFHHSAVGTSLLKHRGHPTDPKWAGGRPTLGAPSRTPTAAGTIATPPCNELLGQWKPNKNSLKFETIFCWLAGLIYFHLAICLNFMLVYFWQVRWGWVWSYTRHTFETQMGDELWQRNRDVFFWHDYHLFEPFNCGRLGLITKSWGSTWTMQFAYGGPPNSLQHRYSW